MLRPQEIMSRGTGRQQGYPKKCRKPGVIFAFVAPASAALWAWSRDLGMNIVLNHDHGAFIGAKVSGGHRRDIAQTLIKVVYDPGCACRDRDACLLDFEDTNARNKMHEEWGDILYHGGQGAR